MRVRDESKELAIREKAMQLIVKEGFHGMSMGKLAKLAKVSPATIYIYFKNREDMLNQIYNSVMTKFTEVALEGFVPEMSFEDGLWLQWKNRLKFVTQFPLYSKFYEQFRNSPLIHHKDVKRETFKDAMQTFVRNAVKRKEIQALEPEVFWSLAYGPFNALVNFHLQGKSMMNDNFKLSDTILRSAFKKVIKSLAPA